MLNNNFIIIYPNFYDQAPGWINSREHLNFWRHSLLCTLKVYDLSVRIERVLLLFFKKNNQSCFAFCVPLCTVTWPEIREIAAWAGLMNYPAYAQFDIVDVSVSIQNDNILVIKFTSIVVFTLQFRPAWSTYICLCHLNHS